MIIPLVKPPMENFRQQFPALSNKAYFNYGGQGPLPQVALDAIYQSYQHIQNLGPFTMGTNNWIVAETNLTRAAIAKELNVVPATITLTEDVTVGCNIAMWGIDWQPGDRLVMTDCEHQGIIATVKELQRRFQIEVTIAPLLDTLNEGNPVDAIVSQLSPNTRLVVLSHILWNTGQVLPLAEIINACHTYAQNIKVLVDAAQSVGVLPLNLAELNVDFYAFTGHKWWCGPEGVGGLYIHPQILESIHPTFIGWRSIVIDQSGSPQGWKPDGRRFEIATSAYPLLTGLRAAIALHDQWGSTTARYQQICENSKFLWSGLAGLSQVKCLHQSPPEAGLVSFQLVNGKSHQQFVELLEQQNVMVRTILHPDCIRACVHYFTNQVEMTRMIDTIAQMLD